jgi:hypothetical protein
MRRRALPLLLLALVACGDTTTPRGDASVAPSTPAPSSSAPAHSYAPDGVVLSMSYSGGLRPADDIGDMPRWAMYGDGRVTTPGARITIYPGAAFPSVMVRTVSRETLDWLAAQARAAGIDGTKRDYGRPPIFDGSNTDFHLSDATGTVDVSVYMLTENDGFAGYTAEQRANRERLAAFQRLLTDPEKWPGATGEDEPYVPTTVAVYARPYRQEPPAGETHVKAQEIAWQGPDPATGVEAHGKRCTLLTGDVLARVLPDLRRATTITRWTYGGKAWSFEIRLLLPDETACR